MVTFGALRDHPGTCILYTLQMRTGDKSLVNMMAERGISISYDHMRRLSTALAYSDITLLEQIVEVVPAQAN